MVYFAASVVWLAAVRQWKYHDDILQLNLGPYIETFRLYLIGEQDFPTSAAVWINVRPSPVNLCARPGRSRHTATTISLFRGSRFMSSWDTASRWVPD